MTLLSTPDPLTFGIHLYPAPTDHPTVHPRPHPLTTAQQPSSPPPVDPPAHATDAPFTHPPLPPGPHTYGPHSTKWAIRVSSSREETSAAHSFTMGPMTVWVSSRERSVWLTPPDGPHDHPRGSAANGSYDRVDEVTAKVTHAHRIITASTNQAAAKEHTRRTHVRVSHTTLPEAFAARVHISCRGTHTWIWWR